MDFLNQNINQIIKLCKYHNVIELYIFGSVLTEKFNNKSDIDLLIEFGDVDIYKYFDNYIDLKESLEKTLNRHVDLVENKTIKNPILRKSIDRNKKFIYGRKDSKVAI
ncbi:MAG: nucleotidyltransferase [Bacteroidetes bacterium GWA2_30_7]|nr:MAG: nucleotidyltransferase [Bacteroidetes bacterium GWA2_30_7]